MKIKNIFYGIIRPVVNPIVKFPTYLGLKQISETTKSIVGMLKTTFALPKATEKKDESFTDTLKRLNLTEQDLQKRQAEFRRLLIIYLAAAILLFCYAVYLAWHHSIHGSLASFVITVVALTQVFRYHFWLFQIKQRKLGCTFRDWWHSNFIGGSSS